MKFLYNIGIRSYGFGISLAALFGKQKAQLWRNGRENWMSTLKDKSDLKGAIWIHASSLGEFEQAKPLIEMIKSDESTSSQKIIVTFFSPSGYEYGKDYELADYTMYLPLDTRRNAQDFIDILNPSIAIFVKYDFWFNTLIELQKMQIPTLYFSSNFRENQTFFKSYATWQKEILKSLDHIFCLTKQSQDVLLQNGFENVSVSGDTRYDKVIQNAQRATPVKLIEEFKGNLSLLILGSSWPDEEKMLASFLDQNQLSNWKIVVAPHDISKGHLENIEKLFGDCLQKYSEATRHELDLSKKILLIDNIGMLSNLYQYADVAFIGGGFGNGLHNILEACAFGNALIYGSNISKYPEGISLSKEGGSILIENQNHFEQVIQHLSSNTSKLEVMKRASNEFVFKHKGATKKVFDFVKGVIQP